MSGSLLGQRISGIVRQDVWDGPHDVRSFVRGWGVEEPFDILDHTADVGLCARGRTLRDVYENAARGMLSLMAGEGAVRSVARLRLEVEGSDAVDLLVAWLHEILYRFDAQGMIFGEVRVLDFAKWRLIAELCGEPFEPVCHEPEIEIKAVTWHRACVAKEGEGWVAEVILDV